MGSTASNLLTKVFFDLIAFAIIKGSFESCSR